MELENTPATIDLESRLHRSKGRAGRTFVASTKVTLSEQRELEMAAQTEGKALSEWARDVLLREARRSKNDALFTEVVATRLLLVSLFRNLSAGQKVTTESINDAMAQVRRDKFGAAKDVLAQYTSATQEGR